MCSNHQNDFVKLGYVEALCHADRAPDLVQVLHADSDRLEADPERENNSVALTRRVARVIVGAEVSQVAQAVVEVQVVPWQERKVERALAEDYVELKRKSTCS